MLFSSQVFILGFLPLAVVLYYAAARSRTLRQLVVVVASLLFYGVWDVRFVPLLVGLMLATWLVAQAFLRWRWRWIPLAGVALNLAALGWFKYANFFADNLAALGGVPPPHWDIVLPLGLSFFAFQKISYLIDLRRGDRHFYRLLDFSMFVFFFPQLIAGPLVRHNEIIEQFALPPRRPEVWENLSRGSVLFVIGLLKKVLLADAMAKICDPLFAAAGAGGSLNFQQGWIAAVCYALQIYFDFSGYSDMAIGMALMFGLRLPFNFNAPYRALSVRDFWRRWHMTLSRFLRDYLYIPLGGDRRGALRQAANVTLTMLLGGLWHGASWTFVVWGGLHGVALAVNRAWNALSSRRPVFRLPAPLGWALTTLFVTVAWVVFRSADFATAGRLLAAMAGRHGGGAVATPNGGFIYAALLIALIGPSSQDAALTRLRPTAWLALPVAAALVFCLLQLGTVPAGDFIYFQF